MLFAVIALSVVLVVVLTAVFKVHPFLSLLLGHSLSESRQACHCSQLLKM